MSGQIPWDRMTPALLERWGGPAPRYTSYPTAVEWGRAFGSEAFLDALRRVDGEPAEQPLSIYVHIPFCRRRCRFCGCASDVSVATADYDAYLDALALEIERTAGALAHRKRVAELHFGGGTPTVLDPPRLIRLHRLLTERLDFSGCVAQALEAAPAVTSAAQIDTLADLGFNRISFGVQDFTPEVQQAVDRVQSPEQTVALIERARTHGMGINIDLMYGLPRQQLATWRRTLEDIVTIGPNRVAVFGYAHVPWMRPHQEALDVAEMPNGAERLALFRAAHERLVDAGYVYIGMDHFSRPDDPLAEALRKRTLWRNFQGYTVKQGSVLIGFGATAISDLGHAFSQNQPATAAYTAAVRESGNAASRGHILSAEDRLRRHVITELMCNLVLDTEAVSEAHDVRFWEHFAHERSGLQRLAADGLVRFDDREIEVTALGRMFVRHVGLVFDTYSSVRTAAQAFSRTI